MIPLWEAQMSRYVRIGARKLPTVLGGGILGVAAIGLIMATAGLTLPLAGELASAAVGMIVAGRYA